MKLHSFFYLAAIYACVFLFVLPPIFIQIPQNIFFQINFPINQFFCALFAGTLLFIEKNINPSINKMNFELPCCKKNNEKKIIFAICMGEILFTLGKLFTLSAILHLLSYFLKKNIEKNILYTPKNLQEITYCILGFAFSAFYEEAVFRVFLPKSIKRGGKFILEKISLKNKISSINEENRSIVSCTKEKKYTVIFLEILICTLFAISHKYLGFYAVLNAAGGHIFLRMCFLKTKKIYTNTAAHFLYNSINLLFMQIISS